jgi:hypothetical protein
LARWISSMQTLNMLPLGAIGGGCLLRLLRLPPNLALQGTQAAALRLLACAPERGR